MNRNSKKIAVTIITGFLGAGKTTFINSLLKQKPETQFALVENEFGDVSIDTKLIKGVEASQMFELKQGCICCTISDEFELVLLELSERFPNIEHLLIETTGIADPAPVVRPFFTNESLKEIYQYNGTICLVDSLNFENSPEKEITIKQIVVADLVLVSKSAYLSEIQKETLKSTLQKINPFAEIDFSNISDSGFKAPFGGFGVNNNLLNMTVPFLEKSRTQLHFTQFPSSHSNITSKTLHFNQPLNKTKFLLWLTYTLDINKNEIYRVKGILCFENEPYDYILQGVGGSFEITEGDLIFGETKSIIVLIGNQEVLTQEFQME